VTTEEDEMSTTKTKSQPKTKTQVKKTTASAEKTGEAARLTLSSGVLDGAYAALGAGDAAIDVLRTRGADVRRELIEALEAARREELRARVQALPQRARTLRGEAVVELQQLADRGRTVVETVRKQPATKQAIERTEVARRQVKAARTSVRKAVTSAVEGAEAAASTLGRTTRS
jgi:hypothetical protein